MSTYREVHRPSPCPCRHPACKAWHVTPAAAVQGVRFTQVQAAAVADLLNQMEVVQPPSTYVVRVGR